MTGTARRAIGAAATVAAVVLALVPVVRHPWLCDDIFITFRYVENALDGLGLVYNPGERVEGYTHFLWALVLWTGARAGIPLEALGRWLPLVFDLALVVLLARTGARLFAPARDRLWGIPLAALLWALHPEARAFASGGLETAAYTFFLVAGFYGVAVAGARSRRATWAGAVAYGLAALTRPEGLSHLVLASAFVFWRDRRDAVRFVLTGTAIVVPLFVWRLAYYGDWLPNPVYAKSASRPYLSQGWIYVGLYFRYYAVLAIGALAAILGPLRWRRRTAAASPPRTGHGLAGDAIGRALVLALAHALWVVATTAWVGGDFMFARFLLPATPFLCLLCEAAVLWAGRVAPVAALVTVGALAGGGMWRQQALHGRNVAIHGIADERSQYPPDLLATRERQGALLRRCVTGTRATFLIQGAQASYAYYGRLPIAIEAYGLTDRTLARLPLERRGRPGHERRPPFEYLLQRRTHFILHLPGARPRFEFARIDFGDVPGEILVYDRELMQHMARCDGVRFTEFGAYFDAWIERAPALDAATRRREAEAFGPYYFAANADPERQARWAAVLASP